MQRPPVASFAQEVGTPPPADGLRQMQSLAKITGTRILHFRQELHLMRIGLPLRLCLLYLTTVLGNLPCSNCVGDLWGISVDPYGTAPPEIAANYNKAFRFDNAGNKLANDIASGSAGLSYPTGVAVDRDGRIFVSSRNTGSILWYDGATGQPLPSPQPGGPLGLFAFLETAAPAQLAFGPDGNLYVSEFFGTSVRVYSSTGQRLPDAATGLSSAQGLAFAPNGDLLVGDGFVMAPGQSARIVRVHQGVQTTFGMSDQGVLSSPVALQFLSNGDLLVVDLLGNYVARFDATGQQFTPFVVIPPAIPDPLPPGVFVPSNNPSDIDLDPEGNVIVSVLGLTSPPDNRGALLRYDLNGNLLEIIRDQLEPIGGIDWTASPATLAGDYDGDNAFGPSDYNKWRAGFGKLVARGNGADGSVNGVLDAADYVVWRKALGAGHGSSSTHAAPEPASATSLVAGLIVIVVATARSLASRSAMR